ncbi:MAG: phage holin family protein [Chloroflexi bacterium]|nr:phage holin family protein [Chloroflexota bacterium]
MSRDALESVVIWGKLASGLLAALWASLALMVQALLVLMAADVAVGLLAAFGARTVSADVCWRGITKKMIVLIIVGACGYLSPIMGIPLAEAVAGFYAAHELLSILQNADRAGLPVPQALKEALVKLSPEPPTPQMGKEKADG